MKNYTSVDPKQMQRVQCCSETRKLAKTLIATYFAADKCGRQVGDKCRIMRPRAPRVGDKRETSVKSCGPEHPEWETSGRQAGDKCKIMWPRAPRVGDKRETSVKSCGPGHPEWEASRRQM